MKTSHYTSITPYITKDGSIIRELIHPSIHANTNQSLAEAIIPVGQQTERHIHPISEEIYYVISGVGNMMVAEETKEVSTGTSIIIPPHTPHFIANTGNEPLIILCCCSPPYSHDDTIIV